MATFKDINGREWSVALDYAKIHEIRGKWCTAERCSHMTGIHECNGLDLGNWNGSGYVKLINDPLLVIGSLWIICRDEAKKEGISEDSFSRVISGDVLDPACKAIAEAMAAFFPQARREVFKAVLKVTDAEVDLTLATIKSNAEDPETMEAMEKQLKTRAKKALTQLSNASSSPALSESVQSA